LKDKLFEDKTARNVGRYRIVAGTTVGAVVFLILVGAVVRMTGSGMGCPDWPTCFGQWVPPTDISQLPPDYKTRFAVAGKEIADFDAFKTWVEYLNRLLGVLIGLFSLATVAAAWPLRKVMPKVFYLSSAGLLAVLVVGGVGAYVVRTDLQAGVVSIHMVLALGALTLFLLAFLHSFVPRLKAMSGQLPPVPRSAWWWALGGLVLISFQVVMGTQVREAVDVVAKAMNGMARDTWIEQLGWPYRLHSVFYYAIVGAVLMLGVKLKEGLSAWPAFRNLYLGLWLLMGGEVLMGLGMHHLGIPAWMQPVHLLLATLLFASMVSAASLLYLRRRMPQEKALTL
jgi:heme a synthase